ncbi:N-6 DNA methylase [Chryseobacterium indoltheticum]|uniref:site-specific DNA-methyltransferase (adenine-specific) n=1 Tax=Chryseobacterium indoltheticum TaxID=254 RepID=A0A381FQX8_9FLAO|nr:N-6 DNA methylase [Chryseobacterium indoltheticum]SUX48552.1 Probable type I restriction enzyme BthVORF4518P M protein [Chryseobacterium indoltheticum]
MLDATTKRRIDSARDILVGKIPDPKSQVEMITIAMIYKFMDDMDNEAVEYGGNRSFFTGDYEKFAWRKLFDLKLSGQEALNLYGDAIASFAFNPNLPQLFRDIFKNAYLPFRDPQTLKLFLKTINDFHYDHSEKLGDAFEYLLSVLGSQGDAGQFRTPRHIIDFMVEVLNPKKGETIADPACGTAGFLISSFKYIMQRNTKKTSGDLLTPDEKTKLMTQFTGFDISPDMVRLSLVNMYLHGFPKPHIEEYDTLTSEDKWDKYYDIILANPPFMTPKGGIRPHKRFTVQANKAEVLFTDYIAEHINPVSGKAAIVVPNGIVATTNKAYKDLRTLLVKESLLAIISLPAGVFQPYSGVKTSILILDRKLSKKSDQILFLKINNDGFDLGAQRRPIDKNDLPNALDIINKYRETLANDSVFESDLENFTLVPKDDILANSDISLSAEPYFIREIINTDYQIVKLKDVCNFIDYRGKTPTKTKSGIRLITAKNVKKGYINLDPLEYIAEADYESWMTRGIPSKGDILITTEAPLGNVAQIDTDEKIALAQRIITIIPKADNLDKAFLKNTLLSERVQFELNGFATGSTVLGIKSSSLKEISIPLPPLNIQQKIVEEIEGYQKIIDGAKQVVKNYRPTISINSDWEMVELGKVCEKITDGTHHTPTYFEKGVIFLSSKNVTSGNIDWERTKYIDEAQHIQMQKRVSPRINDILLAKNGTTGVAAIVDRDVVFDIYVSLALLRPSEKLVPKYLLHCINSKDAKRQFNDRLKGVGVPNLHLKEIKEVLIPLPTIEEQETIVKSIEEELQLVNANKRIIEIFEQKIKEKIDEVWGIKKDLIPVNS